MAHTSSQPLSLHYIDTNYIAPLYNNKKSHLCQYIVKKNSDGKITTNNYFVLKTFISIQFPNQIGKSLVFFSFNLRQNWTNHHISIFHFQKHDQLDIGLDDSMLFILSTISPFTLYISSELSFYFFSVLLSIYHFFYFFLFLINFLRFMI